MAVMAADSRRGASRPLGRLDAARALNLQEEEVHRVFDPGQFEAAAGEQALFSSIWARVAQGWPCGQAAAGGCRGGSGSGPCGSGNRASSGSK